MSKLTLSTHTLFDTFREVTQSGKTWLVVKGVPLVEGVLNGRYVPAEEFGSFEKNWNDIPIVFRHPKQNGGSARVSSPDSPVVGRFYNARVSGKRLVGEYWLDKNALSELEGGADILTKIEKHLPIETSTGYWSESIPTAGKWNEKNYGLIDTKIHPDHIAILPDEIGACSVADGCGLNRNSWESSQVLSNGGSGSGHFDHAGIPGHHGGSLPSSSGGVSKEVSKLPKKLFTVRAKLERVLGTYYGESRLDMAAKSLYDAVLRKKGNADVDFFTGTYGSKAASSTKQLFARIENKDGSTEFWRRGTTSNYEWQRVSDAAVREGYVPNPSRKYVNSRDSVVLRDMAELFALTVLAQN